MTDHRATRRLAAILAADVVGYSRLMSDDEEGTLAALNRHRREEFNPLVDHHGGRIVKLMGDGTLVEFASVVDAVDCAVAIQQAVGSAATDADPRIVLRIGINLGDIIIDGDDIYGDGVNIAARLEQIAEPGGICVSGAAYDTARSNKNLKFQSLGEVRVKNIDRSILVYKVRTDSGEDLGKSKPRFNAPKQPDKTRTRTILSIWASLALIFLLSGAYFYHLHGGWGIQATDTVQKDREYQRSIVIFPFRNLNREADDDYLFAGINEDLLTEFSFSQNLLVIGSPTPNNAADGYNEERQIALELNAKYLLAGSIRRIGNTVRTNARLIESSSGATIWARAFEHPESDIAAVGRDISEKVIALLPGQKSRVVNATKRRVHFPDPKAYDLLLQGNVFFARFTPDAVRASREFYAQAIAIDPKYARPVANIAFTHALEIAFGWSAKPEQDLQKAEDYIKKALSIDMNTHQAHLAQGLLYRSQRRYKEALASFQKAMDIAPNSADAYAMVSLTHVFAGEPDKGLEAIEKAMVRNPDHPFFYLYTKAMALFHQDQFEAAVVYLQKALNKNSDFVQGRLVLASAFAHLDRTSEARWEFQEVLVRVPDFSLLQEQARAPYENSNDLGRYMHGLKISAGG